MTSSDGLYRHERIGWPAVLLLARHGESKGNVANAEAFAAGAHRLDLATNDPMVELSDLGVRQALALGRWLALSDVADQPTVAVTSPYVRAQQTADRVLETAGLGAIPRHCDERLRDREQGILDRLTAIGIRASYPEEADRRSYLGKFWYRPPGGESWADVALRVRAALLDLRLDHAGERIIIVTHDVPLLLIRYVLEDMTPEEIVALSGHVANCGLTSYRYDGERLGLERFNDVTAIRDSGRAAVTAHG